MTAKRYPCPCCQAKVLSALGEYEICPKCGWEDDPAQSADPDLEGGANELSLNEARAEWAAKSKKKK